MIINLNFTVITLSAYGQKEKQEKMCAMLQKTYTKLVDEWKPIDVLHEVYLVSK